MRYPVYPEMKDSGVEWLGEIPEHWGIDKLKYISLVRSSNVDKKSKEGEKSVQLCNYTDVYYNEFISSEIDFMKATANLDKIKKFKLCLDDVIITKDSEDRSDIAIPAYVDEKLPGVVCGYHLALIKPKTIKIYGKYLFRAFQSDIINQQFQVSANGITRYGLSINSIGSSIFIVPPIKEQKLIANFLDKETGRIDQLIDKKEQLIELLQEKRQALISHTVTKGLDPDASMKDSGIEWLGEIPEHWDIIKMTRLFKIIGSGTTPSSQKEEYYNGNIPWVNTAELNDSFITDTNKKITEHALKDFSTLTIYPEGTILIALYGATIGRLGILNIAATVNQACCALTIPKNNIDEKFVFYWLLGNRRHIISLSYGGGQPNISQEIVKQLKVSLPPIGEQKEIVYFIDKETSKIDNLIEKITKQISNLKEYRQALISNAVTGKIDVREVYQDE